MSSSILHVKPEEIDSNEKRVAFTVGIIGSGSLGLAHACLFADAGFKVICADPDTMVASQLAKGKTPLAPSEVEAKLKKHLKTGHFSATNDIKTAVTQSQIIAITTSVGIDEKNNPDYSDMEHACKLVGASLHRDSIVIVMSAVGIGAIDSTVRENVENASGFKAGLDFALAYSPSCALDERFVAATDKTSLAAASTIMECITKKGIKRTNNIKAAELAALLNAVQQDLNDALANEIAFLCEKAHIDYIETQKLLTTNTSCNSTTTTPTHERTREEPYLLLESAESLNTKLRLTTVARETNEEVPKHAIALASDALRNCGKTLRRARVAILGISETPNARNPPKKMLNKLVKMLETKGAKVCVYDPYFSNNELSEMQKHVRKSLTEAVERVDCLVIITGHDQFRRLSLKKLKPIMKMPAAIVDLEAVFEPDKVEMEGFIYRGLGRGVWTK